MLVLSQDMDRISEGTAELAKNLRSIVEAEQAASEGEEGGAEQSPFVGRLTAFEAEMAAQAAALQQQKQEMEQALQASPHAPRSLTFPTSLGKPDDLSTVFQASFSRPRTENKNNRQERESSASDEAALAWVWAGAGCAVRRGARHCGVGAADALHIRQAVPRRRRAQQEGAR